MGKHLLYKTISNHSKPFFVYLQESHQIPFVYRHRRHFTAVRGFSPRDSVGM
jgi:hypothetical protein